MSLNSSSEFSQRTDRGGMQLGSDLEEGEKEVKVKQVEVVEEKGEKMKGSEEKENIEKIIKDSMERKMDLFAAPCDQQKKISRTFN